MSAIKKEEELNAKTNTGIKNIASKINWKIKQPTEIDIENMCYLETN